MCSNSSLPPTYCVSQRGIFTRPMSSAMGWWLQASAMSTRSPLLRRSTASVPSTWLTRSPLKRAKRIEKLVIGTSGGVSAATLRKACESVTTSRGGRCRRSRASLSSRSFTTRAMASVSMQVADGLHLRQDEATSRGLLVDGHDEHGHLAGPHEVAQDGRVVDEVGRRRVEQRLAEVEDAHALGRRRLDDARS